MKKFLSVFLAAVLLITIFPITPASAAYSDVPSSHGFYQEIMFLKSKGVIADRAKFGVDDKVTREEVAVMVSKALGLDGKQSSTKFKDVPSSLSSSGYINSAVKAGVINGYTDGTFRPKGIVNRGQMAIFLANGFKLKTESPKNFKDVKPSMASYSAIKKIIHAGITTGYSDNTYRANDTLTRGQISAFLARAMGFKKTVAKDMKVHFISVGQGDSILIQSPNGKNMLVDGGAKSAGADVVAFLKSKGVSRLDYVVATHPDADHIGGLIAVLNAFPISNFIDSGQAHTTQTYLEMLSLIDSKNINYITPKAGDKLALDSALTISVLNAAEQGDDNNEASIVLQVKYNGISFLLMGDADTGQEKEIMSKYSIQSTILKAGHHGSNTSSSATFINTVKPKETILSYGKANSYGHPHKEVVANLQKVNSKIYSTAEAGNITVTTNGVTYSVSAKPFSGSTPSPAPTPKPAPKPAPKPSGDPNSGSYVIPGAPTTFANCTAMRKYYPSGVKSSHPAYASKHDRDKDGWACER